MMKCIALDDEPLALDIIKGYCDKIPFIHLEKTFSDPLECFSYLNNQTIDLIFLDIQMDGLTGIQFLDILQDGPMVIFTTAYDQYALQGYELQIEDYLLKPIAFDRFLKGIKKAYHKKLLLEKSTPINKEEGPKTSNFSSNFIFLKVGYDIKKVSLDTIKYIEGNSDYLNVVTDQGTLMTLQTFKEIEKTIPEARFIRIHKSYLVPIDRIDGIEKNRIKIEEKVYLPIGATYKEGLFEYLRALKLLP